MKGALRDCVRTAALILQVLSGVVGGIRDLLLNPVGYLC